MSDARRISYADKVTDVSNKLYIWLEAQTGPDDEKEEPIWQVWD